MAWILCSKDIISTGLDEFLLGVDVWIEKPYIINRRLSCSCLTWQSTFHTKPVDIQQLKDHINNKPQKEDLYIQLLTEYFENNTEDNLEIDIQLRKLIPKQTDRHSNIYIIICIDRSNGSILSFPIEGENENHIIPPQTVKWSIEIGNENHFCLWVDTGSESEEILLQHPSINWLKLTLFPRVKTWCENKPLINSMPTLKYVSADRYSALYTELKQKYGPDLNWTERSDPKKYVYEDIAIAAYLLIIWEDEKEEKKLESKQSFIDFGCGNGLLVYLLTKEGHTGLGIDLRKRKIWDIYDCPLQLEVTAVDPTANTIYPNYDWFIGNHSDELTPWIPVMAAKTSYKTNFFLLPCCFHDFDRKFQRTTSSKCQYSSYLEYVEEVIDVCGFKKQKDRLRIPSTKRICYLGMNRNYEESEMAVVNERIDAFIKSRSSKRCEVTSVEDSSVNFVPRCAVEPVLNCTQLDRNFINEVVHLLFNHLLNCDENLVVTSNEDGNTKFWRAGGERSVLDLALLLGKTKLFELKSQCGGLQTLIRNHSHIFQVLSGSVSIRNYTQSVTRPPNKKQKLVKQSTIKRRPCWFLENHPDGCILTSEMCSFK
uniref:tRNA (uracil-O(2)-)-methyltransferase n=1 Tax=Strigamia maritima TaxID=126957 RepID=T1IX25_STRMM